MTDFASKEFAKKLTQDIIFEAHYKGYTYKDIADELGKSVRTVEGYASNCPEKVFPLSDFVKLFRLIKPENALRRLASWCDYTILKQKTPNISKVKSLLQHTSSITKETSDVLAEISKSLEDNVITEFEKEKIIKEIDEAIEALLACRNSLKG